jgi:hypothetical protein
VIGALVLVATIAALIHFAPWKTGGAKSTGAPSRSPGMVQGPKGGDPGLAAKYAGSWKSDTGSGFVLNEDFTASRHMDRNGKMYGGRWSVDKEGKFEFSSPEGKDWDGRFTEDGKTLHKPRTPYSFTRVSGAPVKLPEATPAEKPVPEPAARTAKTEPAKGSPYVGTWGEPDGNMTFVINGDHTAIRTRRSGEKAHGKWDIEEDGDLSIKWDGAATYRAKLSADGKSMISRKGVPMVRKDP